MKGIFSFLVALTLFLSANSFGQIVVQNAIAPDGLVQNVLLGNGVTASNITYNGSVVNAQQPQGNVSFFNAANTTFPLQSGVLLTTGNSSVAPGPNTQGGASNNMPPTPDVSLDPQLNAIAAGNPTNGAILEFDFIPSGDTISFRYVFASEEYPEFSPSTFNDAFGFFLSGANPAGGNYTNLNIALLPGTSTPVTINNVGPGGTQNPTFYVNNLSGAAYGTAIQYDGTTVVLTAVAHVVCGQTYHIKLAICNVGDNGWDSGVFLEANSFGSEAVDIAVATVSGDTSIIENCTNAQFIFSRPLNQANDTLVINYNISGTATPGVDYTGVINPITFLPGEDTVIVTINALGDGLVEAPESVIITALTVTECGDTIVTTGTLYIIDGPVLNIVEVDPIVQCANDSVISHVFVTNGYGPYSYSWNYMNQTNDTAYLAISQNGSIDYIVTAIDACGNTGTDTVTVTMNQTLAIDTMGTENTSYCQNTGVVWGMAEGVTGQPQYNWNGPSPGGGFNIDASVMQNLPAGTYIFTVTDDVCTVVDSIVVNTNAGPIANFTQSVTAGCSPLTVTFTNTSQNTNSYSWSMGNGNNFNTTSTASFDQVYTEDATITLIASDGVCSDTIIGFVDISICGCMSPIALNYNPLAVIDDGSCIFPTPTVQIPNVFTPNGDQINDVFELTTTNAQLVEFTITNRYGSVVYTGSGPGVASILGTPPAWDGKINGQMASEGVYFCQYRVVGVAGDELIGQGFVHLSK